MYCAVVNSRLSQINKYKLIRAYITFVNQTGRQYCG